MEKMLASVQEGARKVFERLFAVLFSRWRILYRPARGCHVDDMVDILTACCIRHNMIVEDREKFDEEANVGTRNILSFDDTASPSDVVLFSPAKTRQAQTEHWRETADLVENTEHHFTLKRAIANHLWNKHGTGDNFE
jgi:Plant transposon protein